MRPLAARSTRHFAVAVFLLAAVAVGIWAAQGRFQSATVNHPVTPALADDARETGKSLYQLASTWTTDGDKDIHLRDLRGKYQIVALMFTSCAGTCPVMVKELQLFAASMPQEAKGRTHFTLVTVDPRDTTETLRQYRQAMKLDEQQWMLLRGTPDAVRELAAVLGFNYEQLDDQQFAHTNLVTVLNPQGEVIHQQQGAGGSTQELLAALGRST